MASAKQTAAARNNIKKAVAAAKRKKTIAHRLRHHPAFTRLLGGNCGTILRADFRLFDS